MAYCWICVVAQCAMYSASTLGRTTGSFVSMKAFSRAINAPGHIGGRFDCRLDMLGFIQLILQQSVITPFFFGKPFSPFPNFAYKCIVTSLGLSNLDNFAYSQILFFMK